MNGLVVDLDLTLSGDCLIDFLLVQWHTPLPKPEDGYKIKANLVEEKRQLLDSITGKLSELSGSEVENPLFIVFPEISMPQACMEQLDAMTKAVERPVFVIGGLEHLSWNEYCSLLATLEDQPEPHLWTEGGNGNHWVNSAIIVAKTSGGMSRYLQVKGVPEANESAFPLFRNEHLLIFRSSDYRPSRRLNFCVQICSDFASPENVHKLRQAVFDAGVAELDMTFLLQANEDQSAAQFKQANHKYFEVGLGLVGTGQGCVVSMNNANLSFGKTEKWGCSKFSFPFNSPWRDDLKCALPTYRIEKDGGNNHSSATFRESGPGIYRLSYKPHYLVSPVPGSGQVSPFPTAEFSQIEATQMGLFGDIPPTAHWLECEWCEHKEELQEQSAVAVASRDPREINKAEVLMHGNSSSQSWCYQLIAAEESAYRALAVYYCCRRSALVPGSTDAIEPKAWENEASIGVKELFNCYGLVQLGGGAFSDGVIPVLKAEYHAEASGCSVVFLWGGGRVGPLEMLRQYMNRLLTKGLSVIASQKTLLICLIQPSSYVDSAELSEIWKSENSRGPTRRAIPGPLSGFTHLQKGDVVKTEWPEWKILNYSEILGGLEKLDTFDAYKRFIEEKLVTDWT